MADARENCFSRQAFVGSAHKFCVSVLDAGCWHREMMAAIAQKDEVPPGGGTRAAPPVDDHHTTPRGGLRTLPDPPIGEIFGSKIDLARKSRVLRYSYRSTLPNRSPWSQQR